MQTLKNPMDAWIYQEIVFETKPDVIVEIGNRHGGSALFFAHLCDSLGKGRIIGLDLSHQTVPKHVKRHPRITFITGDACRNIERVERLISSDDRVLVVEDSSHTYENTLNVLRLYSKLIKVGDYFIVEDSICHADSRKGRVSYRRLKNSSRKTTTSVTGVVTLITWVKEATCDGVRSTIGARR